MNPKLLWKRTSVPSWIAISFILILSSPSIAEARLPCAHIDCKYCITPRMVTDCLSYCRNTCKSKRMQPVVSVSVPRGNKVPPPSPRPFAGTPPPPQPPLPSPIPPRGGIMEPEISGSSFQGSPSQRLLECCQRDSRITPSCYPLCNFDNFNKDALINAYLHKTCPGAAGEALLQCASSGQDHRSCCTQRGVQKVAHERCLVFCNPSAGLPPLNLPYLPCLDKIPDVKQCFVNYMTTH